METEKILIVVDPSAEGHPAHDNVVKLLSHPNNGGNVEFTLLLALDPNGVDTHANNAAIHCDASLIQNLEKPIRDLGITVSTRISWSHEWAESILINAKQAGAKFITLSHPAKGANRSLADDYWKLIRTTTVPLSIINADRAEKNACILVAMDLQDDSNIEHNKRIYEAAMRSAKLWNTEDVHILCAYSDSSNYPDRGRLVNMTGIPNENVHFVQGEPDEVMGELANKLNPILTVMGATRRNTGIRAALRGVKVSSMIRKSPLNVLIVT